MIIAIIGDVHGKFAKYMELANNLKCSTIQLGDFGLMKKDSNRIYELNKFYTEQQEKYYYSHEFIRGNHDNPFVCPLMKGYLGDYSYLNDYDIFVVGGAQSIDRHYRTEGINWWREEELNYAQFYQAIDLYVRKKPSIVISHDCPDNIYKTYLNIHDGNSSTAKSLQYMFDQHKPKYWFFGHHHKSLRFIDNNCTFMCLNELEHVHLDLNQKMIVE